MFTYEIKQDGWPCRTAKGKKRAVESLEKLMAWEGVTKEEWITKGGVIHCYTDKGIFTIEESH